MRYYNENPQVELWKEQARRNQELMLNYKRGRDYYKMFANMWQQRVTTIENEIDHFNKLPWYKKMFFKFKI